jgi:quercetin 2,3-dioxygenase
MITIYPYETLGHANHGWLDARHHFSFAGYRNLTRMGFGVLRVINDDIVSPGKGFGTHPHDNMEIITYVRSGAITHKDSMGNTGRTGAGDVQVMSAGTGVFHSEYNLEQEETRLYQIWITPNEYNVTPRWKAKAFPSEPVTAELPVLVSGQARHAGKDALFMHQDAAIYGGRLNQDTVIEQDIAYQAYILASAGHFSVNGVAMKQGDGAEVMGDIKRLVLHASSDAEIIVIDVPPK